MIRRLLGWLRYADGGPVVEQSAPPERHPFSERCVHGVQFLNECDECENVWRPPPPCPHGVDSLDECGPCTITAIDAAILDAVADRHTAAADRLLEARSAVRRRHLVRTSVPVTPGRHP